MATPVNIPVIDKIYTDGACSGNPGPGGWGVVIYFEDGRVQDIGGSAPATTNNRMELQASIAALETYQKSGQTDAITLYTDSEYVRNGITKWISGWKKKGWKTAAGKPVMNQDLWQELDQLNSAKVTWKYVKGHAGDPGNERADGIAVKCAQGQMTVGSGDRLEPAGDAKPAPDNKSVKPTAQEAKADYAVSGVESETAVQRHTALPERLAIALERLRAADEVAQAGYLVTTQELAELVGLSPNGLGDRGEEWTWRNWLVSRVRKEGNQVLWQLERTE